MTVSPKIVLRRGEKNVSEGRARSITNWTASRGGKGKSKEKRSSFVGQSSKMHVAKEKKNTIEKIRRGKKKKG